MAYPTDTGTSYTSKNNGETIDASHVNALQTEVQALKTKTGIDSSADTASLDYKVKNASSDGGGHVQSVAKGGTGATTAAAGFDALAPTTTEGDIIYRGASANVRLAKGTGLQRLRMNAGATAPEWFTDNATDFSMGALSETFVKTYFNMQFPFVIATGSVDGSLTTDAEQWERSDSTDVVIRQGMALAAFESTGAAHLVLNNWWNVTPSTLITFASSNTIIFETWLRVTTIDGDFAWGLSEDTTTLRDVYNGNGRRAAFHVQDTGDVLWARLGDGTADAGTDISSGITLTNWNNYRIVMDLGADTAYFYINGVLKATLTTNFPTTSGGVSILMGAGRNTNGQFEMTAPNVAIEMNP